MKKLFLTVAFVAALLSGCKEKSVKLEPVQEPSWYQNKAYFDEKNGMYEELPIFEENIVLVGDDYIDRGVWSEFYNDTTIKNRGITYDCAEHVLYRIDPIAAAKPAKIFVCVGYNDIVLQGEDVKSVADTIGMIFDRCKALSPNTHLYWMNTVGYPSDDAQAKKLNDLNKAVEELSHNGVFEYIDISAYVGKGIASGKYSFDGGKHLNGAGYEVLAQAIERQIGKQHLNKAADKKDKLEVSNYYKHRVSIYRSLPRTEGKIVMLGNSLNNNACWTELFPFSPVVNRGISGDVIGGIDQRLDEIVSLKPAKIFLQSGCNDMIYKEKVDVAKVWADYEKLIKDIKKQMPETDLYIQSVFHVGKDVKYADVFNAAADEVNKLLEAGIEKYEYFYLDINSKLVDEEGYLSSNYTCDGIHLSAQGYFIWATELLQGNRLMILDIQK